MTEVIRVNNLSKRFLRKRDKHQTLKSFVLGRIFRKKYDEDFWALTDVNFSVKKGETLGIIGSNGAGKSTLLSLIAKTTDPTKGDISVTGKISTLLELGAGFHPDLTGRENVFLNASILGLGRKETESKYDEIVDLAGIGTAIDSPVKYYSSGMYVRLGFAVAVMCDPDVLLMDEILAVGDESFRKKSLSRIEQFKSEGKTMLIVSHDLETIKKMADRVLLLHEGTIKDMGEPIEVVEQYRNFGVYQDGNVTVKEYGSRDLVFKDIKFISSDKEVKDEMLEGAPLTIEFTLKSKINIDDLVLGFGISDNVGNVLYGTNTQIQGIQLPNISKEMKMRIEIPCINMQRGVCYFSLAAHKSDHKTQYHRLDNFHKIRIKAKNQSEGLLHLPCDFVF